MRRIKREKRGERQAKEQTLTTIKEFFSATQKEISWLFYFLVTNFSLLLTDCIRDKHDYDQTRYPVNSFLPYINFLCHNTKQTHTRCNKFHIEICYHLISGNFVSLKFCYVREGLFPLKSFKPLAFAMFFCPENFL